MTKITDKFISKKKKKEKESKLKIDLLSILEAFPTNKRQMTNNRKNYIKNKK